MVYTVEQLNFFKLSKLAVDEFSEALRQTLKHMWDRKFGPTAAIWDDLVGVRNLFLAKEEWKVNYKVLAHKVPQGMGLHRAVPSHYPRANVRFTRP